MVLVSRVLLMSALVVGVDGMVGAEGMPSQFERMQSELSARSSAATVLNVQDAGEDDAKQLLDDAFEAAGIHASSPMKQTDNQVVGAMVHLTSNNYPADPVKVQRLLNWATHPHRQLHFFGMGVDVREQ